MSLEIIPSAHKKQVKFRSHFLGKNLRLTGRYMRCITCSTEGRCLLFESSFQFTINILKHAKCLDQQLLLSHQPINKWIISTDHTTLHCF
jgi:hypothetical protein